MSNAGSDKGAEKLDTVPKGLNVSLVQVVASALASVSAAFIASLFGVTGTIIGTAVVSVVATSASAIYGLWLRRTQHRLRRLREQPLRSPAITRSAATPTRPGMWPAHRQRPAGAWGSSAGQGRPGRDHPLPQRPPAALGMPVARPGDVTAAHARPPIPERRRGERPARFRLPLVAGVLAVFVAAAGVTTVIEVIARHPLASVVSGTDRGGTTFFGTTPAEPSTTTTVPSTTTTLPTSTTIPTLTAPTSTTTTTTTSVPSAATTTTTLGSPTTTSPSNVGSSTTTTTPTGGAAPAGG